MKNYTDEFSFVLKLSTIPNAGVGVFAVHDIAAGTKLAMNKDGGESRVLDADAIPEPLRHISIVLEDGKRKAPKEFNHLWIVWYLNHSDNPNAALNTEVNNYCALRDIFAGQEILIDYNAFEEPEKVKADYYATAS